MAACLFWFIIWTRPSTHQTATPSHPPDIPTPVPGGAMCTAGMAVGAPVFPPFWVPTACTPAAPQSSSACYAPLSRPALLNHSYCLLRQFLVTNHGFPKWLYSLFHSNHYRNFRFSRTHTHPFWFSPSTQAAIGPQTHLAHPPSIPWPCPTTPTPLQSTLSRFFAVSPIKTGTHSKIFQFSPLGALGMHPYHPLHPPTTPL